MMYDSKIAVAVKSKGKVLREARSGNNTQVFLPFGCEYSLLIKNMDNRRAIVNIWIDGQDVTDGGGGFIVHGWSELDIERFIKNGNLSVGNKFKFIERSGMVSAHRGNKIDDGLIRLEFEFEKVNPLYTPLGQQMPILKSSIRSRSMASGGSLGGAQTDSAGAGFFNIAQANCASASASIGTIANITPSNDVGITVPGGISEQQFTVGAWFPTEGVKHVMVMQMLGEVEGQQVVAPVTVTMKPTCISCGTVNKAAAKFCSECGTALQLVGMYS